MSGDTFALRFGAFIRARRLAAGVTQEALAERIGISQPSISAWERGEAVPTAQALLGALRALKLDIAEVVALLDDDEPEAA